MRRTIKKHKRFFLNDVSDMREYDEIINDPNITILSSVIAPEEHVEYNDEGKMTSRIKTNTYLVHWEEEIL